MEPVVSVMMPAYNAERYIGEAIESVLGQSYPHWELIIVNDGSSDKTALIAASYDDPRIRLLHQTNAGESAARNTALQYMRGEFLAFLDADDAYRPQHLGLAIGYLQALPELDGVYTDGQHYDPQGRLLQTLSSRRRGPFQGDIFEEVVRASDVFGPPLCVVIRRRIITNHDISFDTGIIIGPDWDFLTRVAEVARFGYIGESTCLYRVHETNITVRTGMEMRVLSLARCREKAIRLKRFDSCSPETRWAVFYDLLVELLRTLPERQAAILDWPQFKVLPQAAQAQLLRLMASQAIVDGLDHPGVQDWLRRSRDLNPDDRRCALLLGLYNLSPQLCRWTLQARRHALREGALTSPLGDLRPAPSR